MQRKGKTPENAKTVNTEDERRASPSGRRNMSAGANFTSPSGSGLQPVLEAMNIVKKILEGEPNSESEPEEEVEAMNKIGFLFTRRTNNNSTKK